MLSDDDLLRRLADLLRQSRRIEWQLVAHIGEVDHRRLYAREAAESMFAYCTNVLHLSEHEAYLRITVARAARDHPALLEMLADGRLHLTGIAKLLPHLTPQNRDRVLARAVHKTKEQICELIAELAPRPDAPELIRRLPVPPSSAPAARPTAATATGTGQLGPDRVPSSAPARPGRVEPLAPKRYLVQFTASAEFHEKLQRLTALMRTAIAHVDLALILEQAVSEKLERLEARRFGRTGRPRKTIEQCATSPSTSRCIPAPVRRGVDGRDDRRCRFVDAGSALPGTGAPPAPSRPRACARRRPIDGEHPADVPDAQPLSGRAGIREDAHGAVPEGRGHLTAGRSQTGGGTGRSSAAAITPS